MLRHSMYRIFTQSRPVAVKVKQRTQQDRCLRVQNANFRLACSISTQSVALLLVDQMV